MSTEDWFDDGVGSHILDLVGFFIAEKEVLYEDCSDSSNNILVPVHHYSQKHSLSFSLRFVNFECNVWFGQSEVVLHSNASKYSISPNTSTLPNSISLYRKILKS